MSSSTKIKVCGMTNLPDAEQAAGLGAWAIGIIHDPDSPRYTPPDVAAEIGAALKRRCEVAGVFVNPTLDQVAEAVENATLTIVQLHGDEGPEFCEEVARRTGAKVIKAIAVHDGGDVRGAEVFRTDFHLFDAYVPGVRGGTGQTFDWKLLGERRSTVPMILAGGLNPGNAAEAVAAAHPFAIDVTSGVEAEPGRKDPKLVEALFEAVPPGDDAEETFREARKREEARG